MSLEQKLELARLELLDMGLRGNPLLSIPKIMKFLEVIERRSEDVFSTLVENRKAMSFLPRPEIYESDEGEKGGEALPSLRECLADTSDESRFGDRFLQTEQSADKLDTRLLKIESEAHALLQEQGIDVLHLAMGILEWYEGPNVRTPRYAPLVLIPVEMKRESARTGFTISYTDIELSPNRTLAAKLRGEFRVQLPDYPDEFVPYEYFDAVEKVISRQSNWKLHRDKMYLGLFSSGKFQMYADLDPAGWPSDAPLTKNPLLKKVLEGGFRRDGELLEQMAGHQKISEPEKLRLVKDADTSQMEALIAAVEGANLIIQGPPGTGKSQTITNLIAEAVARGKKVLFVAQKMAALEVVKSRLDETHLGDSVLELHSHKSRNKAVLDSLKSAFSQGTPAVPDRGYEYRRLAELRQHLDTYAAEISRPILNSGMNFLQALGEMLQLQKKESLASVNRIRFDLLKRWSSEELDRATRTLQTIEAYLREFGRPDANVFSESALSLLSPSDEQDIRQLTDAAHQKLTALKVDCNSLTQLMRLPDTETFSDIDLVYQAGQRALSAPHLQGVKISTQDWQLRRDDIRELVVLGRALNKGWERLDAVFIESALSADLLPVRMGLAGRADKWWRIFSGEYRNAKAMLRGYVKDDLAGNPSDWLANVDLALEYQSGITRFAEIEGIGQLLFGAQWQGRKSDWDVLSRIAEWIFEVYDEIGNGELPAGLTDFLEASPDVRERSGEIEELADRSREVAALLEGLTERLKWSEAFSKAAPIVLWSQNLESWRESSDQLYVIVRFNQLESDIRSVGLKTILPELRSWRYSPDILVDWLKLSFYSGLVDTVYSESDQIGRFDRVSHERMIHEFRELDTACLNFAQEELVRKLHESLPSFNAPGEMELIRREIGKKRRHIPIRRLISEAGNVIQQAKPVFMMSPMSVATYLPQGKLSFDLVIFDEASQIPAPEALGALCRAQQAVVVGDSKQMPPTNFFSKAVEITDEEADQSVTADVESILTMMQARGTPERMLTWHYRSRHESLIAVSNDQFYNNRLVCFPSSGAHPDARGLSFNYLPDALYDRGKTRTNVGEAKAVAQAVLEHSVKRPHLSLGVVAFSTAQREMILLEVERIRREHPETEGFIERHAKADEFFIKNLENVQGDERDVIFISVGYGRTTSGKVSQDFGPLNGTGGERRLNVLISRAKFAMQVFANFRGDDLRTDASSPFGVRALKVFLDYAEKGELPAVSETGKEPDSPFEVEVMSAIKFLGFDVEPQVGCLGYSIDLAIVDPGNPGRYLLAVECDGASYHSSASARERDRLRQGVLEELGWRFHRIWSTEWFRNSAQEVIRLQQAIERAIDEQARLDERGVMDAALAQLQQPNHAPAIERAEFSEEDANRAVALYEPVATAALGLPLYVDDFLEIPSNKVKNAILVVSEHEGPIHVSILTARLIGSVGLSRAGQRIRTRVLECIKNLEHEGAINFDGSFVKLSGMKSINLRDWSGLPANQRKFEFVSRLELSEALFVTVQDAYSVDREGCMSAALNLIGFKRLTGSIQTRLEEVLNDLVEEGRLLESSGRLQVSA